MENKDEEKCAKSKINDIKIGQQEREFELKHSCQLLCALKSLNLLYFSRERPELNLRLLFYHQRLGAFIESGALI